MKRGDKVRINAPSHRDHGKLGTYLYPSEFFNDWHAVDIDGIRAILWGSELEAAPDADPVDAHRHRASTGQMYWCYEKHEEKRDDKEPE